MSSTSDKDFSKRIHLPIRNAILKEPLVSVASIACTNNILYEWYLDAFFFFFLPNLACGLPFGSFPY